MYIYVYIIYIYITPEDPTKKFRISFVYEHIKNSLKKIGRSLSKQSHVVQRFGLNLPELKKPDNFFGNTNTGFTILEFRLYYD